MYNGWLRGDKPCPLFPYDWTATNINSFCFDQNDKCKLHVADQFDEEKDLCFSFEYGERVFIYVKLDRPQATNSIIRSNVNINSLSNLSHLVDDMYDYLDTYSRDEIIALLDYLNYTDIEDIQDKPTNELLKKLKYIIKHNYFNLAVKPIEISQQPSAPPSERSRRSRRQKPPPTPLEQPLEQPSAPPLEQPSAPPSERSRRSRRLKPPPQPLEQILEQPSAQPSDKSRRSRRQKPPSAPPSEKNTKLSRSRIQPQPLEKPSAQPTARRRMLPSLQRQQSVI